MRLLSFLMTFLLAALLTACGGGGGSPGLSSGPISAFSVVAPATVTLQVGLQQSYAIKGGVKPYSVFSTDPAVSVGWVGGDDALYVGTVSPGKATITAMDAKGAKFDLIVTSGSSRVFFTTAAPQITITPGVAFAQTYTLGGGTGPYVATSRVPSVATVAVNGNQMTITGVQISNSPSTVTIFDAAGATLTVEVTVGTVPLTVTPATITMPVGGTLRAVITGGTPPYRPLVLDNCSTNAQVVQGNILQATGSLACTGTAITVVDANNQTAVVNVTITAGLVGLWIAPSVLAIPENSNTPNLSLLVYGANGPIQVFSTNTTMLVPQTPVSNADGTFTIPLTGGNTCSAVVTGAVAGVDNSIPPNGTYTDPGDIAPVPATGGDRVITINVLDSTGRQGSSVLTVKDTNGAAGC